MTEDEKRRVKSDVIEAMRIAIEDSLSPTAHVPGNMAVAYKAAEAGFAAGIEALAGPPEREGWVLAPKVPTPAMMERAAFNLCAEYGVEFVRPLGQFAQDAYAELLSAAPKP